MCFLLFSIISLSGVFMLSVVLFQIMQCLESLSSVPRCKFINCFMMFWALLTTSAGLMMMLGPSDFLSYILLLVILLGFRRVIIKTEKAKAVEAMKK